MFSRLNGNCLDLDLRSSPQFGSDKLISEIPISTEMREHPLRSLLSRLLRGPGNSFQIELVYRHRGAPDDQIGIRVSTISRLGKGWFMLEDGDTQIPYHRVLYVRDLASGATLWEKRQPGLALGRAL